MKYILTLLFAAGFAFNSYAQDGINEMKHTLTGDIKKRWLFYKTEEVTGSGRTTISSECIYSDIVFGLRDSAYIADRCTSGLMVKGGWEMQRKGDKSYLLKIDRVYDIKFKYKEHLEEERLFMVLTLKGKTRKEPTMVYYYLEDPI